jgi:hypothetical protein
VCIVIQSGFFPLQPKQACRCQPLPSRCVLAGYNGASRLRAATLTGERCAESSHSAYVATFVCHASAGSRSQSANHPGLPVADRLTWGTVRPKPRLFTPI